MTRELSKFGGVPKGSASSAILLPAGSKISNTDPAVPKKTNEQENQPRSRGHIFRRPHPSKEN
jgi:hypothetical protein